MNKEIQALTRINESNRLLAPGMETDRHEHGYFYTNKNDMKSETSELTSLTKYLIFNMDEWIIFN